MRPIKTETDLINVLMFLEQHNINQDLDSLLIYILENEGVINGVTGITITQEEKYIIITFRLIYGLSKSIEKKMIEWAKYDCYKHGNLFSNKTIIMFGNNDTIFQECGFKLLNNKSVYRNNDIKCVIKLYQDVGPYTRKNPKTIEESLKCFSEHEAKRMLFDKYHKEWYILSINFGNEELAKV